MARNFVPRPYQKLIIDHIITHPRCAIWAGMGMGKTSATLFALSFLKKVFDEGPVLVLGPLRVVSSTWPDEVSKWDELHDLRVSVLVGKAHERRRALKKEADIYCMNYENLPWLVKEIGSNPWPFKVVVADEATRLKSFRTRGGGARARALALRSGKDITRFIELTGTPAPNGLLDLWGQIWFLDHGERLMPSFSRFQNRWFRPIRVGSDAFAVRWEPCEWTQNEIQDKVRDLCLSIEAADWFPIEEPVFTDIEVELPVPAKEVYDQLKEEMYVELLTGETVEAFSAAACTMKCLQVASGAMYTDETSTEWAPIHDAKIEALKSIVNEANGAPVLVAYHWKHDLARLKEAFPEGRELDKDPETIRAWNKGQIPVLFAHPASAGHGLNLQDGGNILVFFSHWWDLEQYQQIIERIGPTRQLQAGHPRPVFVYHLIAKGTLDKVVMQRRKSKESVQDLLMESMKEDCNAEV